MAQKSLKIKYERSIPGNHASYGPKIESAIERLTGRGAEFSKDDVFPRCPLKGPKGYVERHEDGPQIWIAAITAFPAYVTAAIALAAAWRSRKKQRGETSSIEISGNGFRHELDLSKEEDLKLFRYLARHYGKKK